MSEQPADLGGSLDAAADPWASEHSYETPMDVAWQFDYCISQEKLENLYKKAKVSQWNADEDLD